MTSATETAGDARPVVTQNQIQNQIQAPAENTVLSPHLQVWKFTVTMASSITHRFTGVALYGGAGLLALWLYATAFNAGLYNLLSALLGSPLGIIILAGFAWSLFYHIGNGIRHLFWDIGKGLAYETARTTAWLNYASATILTLVVLVVGLS